ncbi:MAG: recombinase family protein [Candidatus Cloacimonetes bacterium]|jgi:site-specific DNA recombinase|nr:recombinase family protein [Candidatus Cloacimonadota bacterium]
MPKISRIEPIVPAIKPLKKVAAYARVSMQSERMMHSLSAQISYYSKIIQKNPDWEYAGVYADDFISGTNTVKRDEFKQMLSDCEAGKIDIILTKSISRFARNTVDLLETVRHLKSLGIEVRFEKENINSMSGDGELMLSILASFAQEESRSISENIRWATKNRFEQGIPNGKFRIFGYRWEDDHLVIEPEEAEIVKRIFQNFLDGKSRLETEKEFAAEGITTANGCRWVDSNIKVVLTNITYTGNLLLQKEFIEDPITKRRKKNRGELPQYFVENTHEPIIDMETFQYVQDEIARRKELGALANKSLNTCCFTGKIKCPHCGVSYMHNRRNDRGYMEYWNCGSKKKKKVGDGCPVGGTINHQNMVKVCTEVLGLTEFDENAFLEQVDVIYVPKRYVLEFHMADGRVITKDCPNTGHKDCWTAEYRAKTSAKRKKNGTNCIGASGFTGKIKCKNCGCNFRKATQPSTTAKDGKAYYWRCAEHSNGCKTAGLREDVLKPLFADVLGMAEFDDALFRKKVDYVWVLSETELEMHLMDGTVQVLNYEPPARKCLPRTEEQKEHMRKVMKSKWTPERKAEMSERMKQMRKERGENWRKEK